MTAPDPIPTPSRPSAFLFPGMHGGDPALASLVAASSPAIDLILVEHPALEAPVSHLRDMAVAGRAAALTVAALSPTGPLRLVGYSFGGSVAYEAACALADEGRTVSFLGLVDPSLPVIDCDLHSIAAARPRRQGMGASSRLAAQRFMSRSIALDQVRKGLGRVCDLLPGNHPHGARRRLVAFLRMEAIYDWTPRPLDVRGTLVLSDQFHEVLSEGWGRLSPSLEVVRIPGRHVEVMGGARLRTVSDALSSGIAASCGEVTA